MRKVLVRLGGIVAAVALLAGVAPAATALAATSPSIIGNLK